MDIKVRRHLSALIDIQGMIIYAYALYWEAITTLRRHHDWTKEDFERIHVILDFIETRARYSSTTFSHKILFLKGEKYASIKLNVADLHYRQEGSAGELDSIEEAIKLAKKEGMLNVQPAMAPH